MNFSQGTPLGMKLVMTKDHRGHRRLHYRCHFCGWHMVELDAPNYCGEQWRWNGKVNEATLSPAVLVAKDGPGRCHHFVTGGLIHYLADCQHEFAGMTLPLLDFDSQR